MIPISDDSLVVGVARQLADPEKRTEVPRWIELQCAIDYGYWRLEEIAKELQQHRSPIDAMIDTATGYSDALEDEARALMAQTTSYRAEFEALMGVES